MTNNENKKLLALQKWQASQSDADFNAWNEYNKIFEERGEEIAGEFGFTLAQVRRDFEGAQDLCRAGGTVAEELFARWLADKAYESRCESSEALRNEERAHGSRYGDRDFDY